MPVGERGSRLELKANVNDLPVQVHALATRPPGPGLILDQACHPTGEGPKVRRHQIRARAKRNPSEADVPDVGDGLVVLSASIQPICETGRLGPKAVR